MMAMGAMPVAQAADQVCSGGELTLNFYSLA